MQVKVEHCNGRYYRLEWKTYNNQICWENVRSEKWGRKTSSEALDILEKLYHIPRKSIRFVHR